jgi:hypothetical protein
MLSMRNARMNARIDREQAAAQREIDRMIEVRKRRTTAYERYLAAFRGVNSMYYFEPQPENSEKVIKAVNEYWLAYVSLFHIASDPYRFGCCAHSRNGLSQGSMAE